MTPKSRCQSHLSGCQVQTECVSVCVYFACLLYLLKSDRMWQETDIAVLHHHTSVQKGCVQSSVCDGGGGACIRYVAKGLSSDLLSFWTESHRLPANMAETLAVSPPGQNDKEGILDAQMPMLFPCKRRLVRPYKMRTRDPVIEMKD